VDIELILSELELYNGILPRKALEAAIAQQDEITPALLDVFREPKELLERLFDEEEYMLPIYALFLLAQFREQQAYPLIVGFFAQAGEEPVDVMGDLVTSDLNRILAGVALGDTTLIKQLIENPEVSEWTRSAALKALISMVAAGELSRETVIDYFRHLFQTLPRTPDGILNYLVAESNRLYPQDLLAEIRQAFEEDLIDTFYIDLNWIEEVLAVGMDKHLQDLVKSPHYALVEDTIKELNSWAAFKPKASLLPLSETVFRNQSAPNTLTTLPQHKPSHPGLGRNDPCWCGSGKKYKNCHLRSDAKA
jgi:hypothetical protein